MILHATMPRLLGQSELSSGKEKQRISLPSFTLLAQLLQADWMLLLEMQTNFIHPCTNHSVKCQPEKETSVEIILFIRILG